MQVHELKCFGAAAGYGNTALVVENGPANRDHRQAFATQQNRAACVFLDEGERTVADYFYPHARSPLCLHATLAAAHVLLARTDRDGPVLLETAMRGQVIRLERTATGIFAAVRRQAVAPLGVDANLARELLGEPGLELASPPLLSSVGSPKLMVEVRDAQSLHALRPPLDRILEWGKNNGVNGCYAYCMVGDGVYEGRNFNHADPGAEDSATGVAAGALAAWLQRGLTLFQGAALGNPCRMDARVRGQDILVGGSVEAVV